MSVCLHSFLPVTLSECFLSLYPWFLRNSLHTLRWLPRLIYSSPLHLFTIVPDFLLPFLLLSGLEIRGDLKCSPFSLYYTYPSFLWSSHFFKMPIRFCPVFSICGIMIQAFIILARLSPVVSYLITLPYSHPLYTTANIAFLKVLLSTP